MNDHIGGVYPHGAFFLPASVMLTQDNHRLVEPIVVAVCHGQDPLRHDERPRADDVRLSNQEQCLPGELGRPGVLTAHDPGGGDATAVAITAERS